jgi:hypothetical protein
MKLQQLLIDTLQFASTILGTALKDLTLEELNRQTRPDANSIGWIAWHLTRNQDRAIAEITGKEHVWIEGRWYDKFGRTAEGGDTGFGHTIEQAAAFRSPDAGTQMAYHKAVVARTEEYLRGLTEAELDRKTDHPVFHTVAQRLVAVYNDGLQHIGQISYARGLIQGKGWSSV